MKIVVNERLVASRVRLANIATAVGFGALIAGLVISLVLPPEPFFWVSLGALLLGIIAASIGATNMNRWRRVPRADQVIDRGMKGFDDRYRVYHYVLPAPHVVLAPTGLHVITALLSEGNIHYENGRWRRDFSVARMVRFMADEGLGRPFEVADQEVAALRQYLEKHDLADGVEIDSALVFVHPKAQVFVKDPPRPVLPPKDIKRAIRRDDKKMPAERYRRLLELFEGQTAQG